MFDLFSQQDWQRIRAEYEGWWTREREKPILHLSFWGADPGMKRPEGLITTNLYNYDETEPPERIAEKMEYLMRCNRYEFQAYPHIWMYFGPIYSVEFLGCRPTIRPETVWFSPEKVVPPSQLHIAPDPASVFLPREKAIRKAVSERFGGGYVISGSASGAGFATDILAEFYGHEELSYILYDEPEEAKRLMAEAVHALGLIREEVGGLSADAIGYTGWGGLYAPEPWNSAQCDYCAMIGPELFDEFVLPDLVQCFRESSRYNYYHLDGPGEIIHMDKILAIPELKCMQWVAAPNGDPALDLQVYERIHKAGKNMWVTGDIEDAMRVADHNGTAKGIYWYGGYPLSEYDRVMKLAEELMQ